MKRWMSLALCALLSGQAAAELAPASALRQLGSLADCEGDLDECAALTAQGIAGARRGSSKVVSAHLQPAVLKAAYGLDKFLSPHEKFTREPVRVDPRPLHEQAAQMEQDIRCRFLAEDGKLFMYQKPMSLGDMAIWHGTYAFMTVLRYVQDRSPESLEAAEKAYDGLELMYRQGLPIVRGILPKGIETSSTQDRHYHQDGTHQWLEDASIDQASGWLLGVVMAERRLPSRRTRAQELMRRFTDDLIKNGFSIKNSDGSETKHGNMGHGLFFPPPGALMSMTALADSAQTSPARRYACTLEAFACKGKDVAGSLPSAPALWRNTSTNNNIGFLALTSALLTEQGTERWLLYAQGMVTMVKGQEQTGNSFWLYLSYWALEQRPEMLAYHQDDPAIGEWMSRRGQVLALAKKSMLEFDYPRTKLATEKLNSERKDIEFVKWPISGKKTVAQPLPVSCRPAADNVFQRDQYALDDWRGAKDKPAYEFTGLDFLTAYYLGLQDGGISRDE